MDTVDRHLDVPSVESERSRGLKPVAPPARTHPIRNFAEAVAPRRQPKAK
ncbi:hypothetical protein CKA32_002461 [Geitlerinema sp. FC II]|nr:hypothetical protein CKA32_002461 [Geitlerinema sp. FC II]